MTHSQTQTTQPGFPFLLLELACISQPNKLPKMTMTEIEEWGGLLACLPSLSFLSYSSVRLKQGRCWYQMHARKGNKSRGIPLCNVPTMLLRMENGTHTHML